MLKRSWKILSEKKIEDLSELERILLENRGLPVDKVEEFLNPPDPSSLITDPLPPEADQPLAGITRYFPDLDQSQLRKAVDRIDRAIASGEKVTIWGDYDVDGVCSTAILWQTIYDKSKNARPYFQAERENKVLPYIPDRFTEGYGLNKEGVEKLAKEGTKLLITCDTGIMAREEIEYARSLGVDVIVTDHHLIPEDGLPSAYAVVHTTHLCGTGVAWLLANSLWQIANSEAKGAISHTPYAISDLDLVAIATIADMQPLLGANRSLVKYGLEELNKAARPGIAELLKVAGLAEGKLGTYHVSWMIAPRINAIGRMEQGMDALRLLCTKDKKQAFTLAHVLNEANVRRQEVTDATLDHAREVIRQGRINGKVIILYHDAWHEGVIGLVAGRLAEEYYRPAIVISKGDGFSKGSARSVNGVNIVALLRKLSHLLEDVGGHEAAAGFTIQTENLNQFRDEMYELADKEITQNLLTPILKVDLELPLKWIGAELLERLKNLEPFGVGNPKPTFAAYDVEVLEKSLVGKQKNHLKLFLSPRLDLSGRGSPQAAGVDALWFGKGEIFDQIPQNIDLVYQVDEDNRSDRGITVKIKDLRKFDTPKS